MAPADGERTERRPNRLFILTSVRIQPDPPWPDGPPSRKRLRA